MITYKIIKYKPVVHQVPATVHAIGQHASVQQRQLGPDWFNKVGQATHDAIPKIKSQKDFDEYWLKHTDIEVGTIITYKENSPLKSIIQATLVVDVIKDYNKIPKFHRSSGEPYAVIGASLAKVHMGEFQGIPAFIGPDCIEHYRKLSDQEMKDFVDDRVQNHITRITTFYTETRAQHTSN